MPLQKNPYMATTKSNCHPGCSIWKLVSCDINAEAPTIKRIRVYKNTEQMLKERTV